jgi:tryptophan-rich sensory protein
LIPPNGVFGPVWTVLYALMAFAIWRVLSAHPAMPGRGRAVALFYIQLALNGLWSWSFFAAHSPAAGLVNILVLDAAVIATILLFRRIDRLAAWCLVPYLAWIAFATYLNAGVLILNR